MIQPKKILVVDDQELNREALSHILKKFWHEVEQANWWIKAIKMATTQRFDYIFMDLEMPDMDWIKASIAINAHTWWDLKIIALSWHSDERTIDNCLKNWMSWYLIKPFSIDKILDFLK